MTFKETRIALILDRARGVGMNLSKIGIRTCAALIGGVLIATTPAAADDVAAQLKRAESLARQSKSAAAYAALEKAGAAIARRLSVQYAKTFPGAPQGWSAGPVQNSAKGGTVRLGRGVNLRRNYFPQGRKAGAYAQLIAHDRGMIASFAKLRNDPKFKGRSKSVPVEIAGVGTAYLQFSPKYRNAFISILIGDRFILTVSANRIDSPEIVKKILMSWDFDALKKAGGIE